MMYGASGGFPQPVATTATFESASKRSKGGMGTTSAEDQLPAMPSWSGASEQHVEDTSYQPARDLSATRAQESIPLQEQRRASPGPPVAYTDNIPLQDRRSPPARSLTTSPSFQDRAAYHAQDSTLSPSPSGFEHDAGLAAPETAYGAASGAAYHAPQKPSINTSMSNPAAFARLPASPISPVTPAASSVYSANPPPSYHTGAAFAPPMPMPSAMGSSGMRSPPPGPQAYRSPPQQQAPFNPPQQMATPQQQNSYQAYTPYSPPAAAVPAAPAGVAEAPGNHAFQAYNPYSGGAGPVEMGSGAQTRSELHGGNPGWGEGVGRKPVQGSWRDV